MTEQPDHLDRETAERLLDGAAATPGSGLDRLESLLAGAAAHPRPAELAGEDAAAMAFRAAAANRNRFSWRRLLTIKVIAIIAAVAVGGLAFASTTGIIPTPFKVDPPVTQAPPTSHSPPGHPTTPAPSATPAAQRHGAKGLCNAYLAKSADERGKALQGNAFTDLIDAAGGAGNVPAYCAEFDTKPDKSHPAKPSKAADPGQ